MSTRRPVRLGTALALALAAVAWGCSDDAPADNTKDAGEAAADADAGGDAQGADAGGKVALPAGEHVGADLSAHLPATTAKGAYARAFAAGDGFTGSAAQARKGDWIIGNAHVRYAIQGKDRHIGVCPWGGNPLDGSARRADGSWSDDEMGEHCLLFNLGRTLMPEHFEVLADGKDGGPAVLAVTGPDELLDFINLPSMLANFPIFGDDLELPMNPDVDVPLTITRYYILAPDERALRVVTALRNDGKDQLTLGVGELVDSGGEVEFFNPAAASKGFGSGGGFGAEKLDWIAFRSPRGSHAYAPPQLNGGPGAGYLAVGGAAGILQGGDNLLGLLLGGKDKFDASPAAIKLQPGAVALSTNLVVAGTGSLDTVSAPIWRARGVKLREVQGVANNAAGKPVGGARISAIFKGAAHTQTVSAADGKFTVRVPEGGGWKLRGWHPGYGASDSVSANGGAKVLFGASGTLAISVRGGDGEPHPAKVTVYCKDKCPEAPQTLWDSGKDRPGEGAWEAFLVGVDGELKAPLPAGEYRVVVSAGPTMSLWPEDAHVTDGELLTVKAGDTVSRTAVVRKAVDTGGWLSGDFHVHAVNSPDAQVENRRRVRTFLAEGVDILVPTDHDYITDMTPHIAAEKAGGRLATMPGVEVTPFDYGHFNAYPLQVDKADLSGGALDWAGGKGKGMDPPAIRAALAKMGGAITPIVQINHPSSYLGTIGVDILGGISHAARGPFRVTDKAPDPKTGDTGMYTDDFDAIELLTGHRGGGFGGDSFGRTMNWWFTLLSRGVRWTGTAVSDSHSAISSQAGGSRSYIRVGAGKDSVATFDAKALTEAMHAGRVVGSDGLFARMWIEAGGKKVEVGGTIALPMGQAATVTVDVQAPYWLDISRVELYRTPTQTYAAPGAEPVGELPKPTAVRTWGEAEKTAVAGYDPKTKRLHLQAVFTLQGDGKDGYLVALAHGDTPMPKAVVAGRKVLPLAFTNPVFLDGDGGGYNNPPLTKKVLPKVDPPPPPPRPGTAAKTMTIRELRALYEAIACGH